MFCVRPGVLLTKASRLRLESALMALVLLAFERPATATSAPLSDGNSSGLATAMWNAMSWNSPGSAMGDRFMSLEIRRARTAARQAVAKAVRAASTVAVISAGEWADETNPASKAEGAR